MAMVKIYYFLSFFLFCSCDKLLNDDVLSLNKKDIIFPMLRLDGCFFEPYGAENKCSVIILYRNGVYLHWNDGVEISELNNISNYFNNNELLHKIKNVKFAWGIVKIENNIIKTERWYPSQRPLKAYIKSGIILNDSTFVLNSSIRSDGSDFETISQTYYFKKYSPKPDSTNSFVR